MTSVTPNDNDSDEATGASSASSANSASSLNSETTTNDSIRVPSNGRFTHRRAIRPCDNCDEGQLREAIHGAEVVCDTCATAHHVSPPQQTRRGDRQRQRRQTRQQPWRDIDILGHRVLEDRDSDPLVGGYGQGYRERRTGSEYAIDANEDTVLAPHARNWTRG